MESYILERLHIHASSLVLRNGSLLNSSIISGVHPPHASFGTLEKSMSEGWQSNGSFNRVAFVNWRLPCCNIIHPPVESRYLYNLVALIIIIPFTKKIIPGDTQNFGYLNQPHHIGSCCTNSPFEDYDRIFIQLFREPFITPVFPARTTFTRLIHIHFKCSSTLYKGNDFLIGSITFYCDIAKNNRPFILTLKITWGLPPGNKRETYRAHTAYSAYFPPIIRLINAYFIR